jgi:outer membrane protein assembly factor BamD (BamD/ComL family)
MRVLARILPVWLALLGAGCSIRAIDGEPGPLLAEGKKLYEAEEYRQAARRFKGIRKYQADSIEAEEALYYYAECLRQLKDGELAFEKYKRLLEDYPNSRFAVATAEGEYALGVAYLDGKIPGFLFFGKSRGTGVDVLEHMQIHFKHHRLADDALIRVSEYQIKKGYNLAATETLRRLLSEYPRSQHSLRARYELGEALLRMNRGALYDKRILFDARRSFADFVASTEQAGLSERYAKQLESARDRIRLINNRLAERHYETGRFYERVDTPDSAIIYYQAGIREYPGTEYAKRCKERIDKLRPEEDVPMDDIPEPGKGAGG